MAIRKLDTGVSSWNSKMEFPKDFYKILCVEEEFGNSKNSGSCMLTRTWEIISPETVKQGDKTLVVAGISITQYRTTKVKDPEGEGCWDKERSDKAWGAFCTELQLAGVEVPAEGLDDENTPCLMKGKTMDAIIYAKKDVARKKPSPGQRIGEPIKDAYGKEVATYQLQIEQILGPSSTVVNSGF